jgi:pimeloyl-ACP methyl ester carboxylesterase
MRNWILIRGLARGQGHWGGFDEKLKKAFPQDKIHYVDIPGNGHLKDIPTPLRVSAFIPIMEKQLQEQNFNPAYPTYGYSLSLGSMAMVEWAKQKPNFFEKIYISNTSAANFSNIFHRLSIKAMALGLRMRLMTSQEEKEMASLQVTTSLSKEKILSDYKDAYDSMLKYSLTNSAHPKNILRQLLAASVYHFPEKPPTEVVLMSGMNDAFVSQRCSKDIENKWHCKHVIHPSAGHDITFEFPDWVIAQISSH